VSCSSRRTPCAPTPRASTASSASRAAPTRSPPPGASGSCRSLGLRGQESHRAGGSTVPKRVVVIVPFALDETGMANRRAQLDSVSRVADIEVDCRPVKAGPALLDSHHDAILADLSMYEAGVSAQEDGYDAVCIDTMSDSGVNALRSMRDIPVIGPGRASCLTALMLGSKFSVLTQYDGWKALYKKGVR